MLNKSGYTCLNKKTETISTRGKTIKDFIWARQSWPVNYFNVKNTDHRGISVEINTKFHRRNRILRIKNLTESEKNNLQLKCGEAIKTTASATELYNKWLKILRETYGSMPRNGTTITGRPNEDLLEMGLQHSELNPTWKHLNRASSQLPTNANSWTSFLKELYNFGDLKTPGGCTQKAQGATKLDDHIIAGAIKKLAKRKTPGPDGVRSENITGEQTALLNELWKRITEEGTMPKFMNDTLIHPIHKKGDSNNPANFRPISLLNTVVKTFELAVLDKHKDDLLRHIPREQFGFKPKVSALDQVEVMMSQVSRCRRESGQAYLLFYDLQKAFDSVRRDDLYSIMSKRGLPPELIQATKLLNTNQAMKIENLMMPWIPMSKGVRQGSSLSPLLFTTFLTLIEIEKLEKLCNAKIRLYADDIVIICPSAEKAKEVDDYLKKTFARFGLSINYAPGKSCYMQTSQAKNKYTTKIGDLERVESYQYLGCLLSLDKRNSISYRGLTKTQSTNRNSKIKQIAKKFSWMLGNRKTTAADVNNLILSLTRGNLYGVINPHTNLNFDFRTKGSAHIQKWETALRGLIMDSYELPIWTKSDLLHTLTGVPHFRIILLQEAISKIKRWRTLIGNGSPLSKPEIKD